MAALGLRRFAHAGFPESTPNMIFLRIVLLVLAVACGAVASVVWLTTFERPADDPERRHVRVYGRDVAASLAISALAVAAAVAAIVI